METNKQINDLDKQHNRLNISKYDFEMCINYLSETANVGEGSYAYEALWMMAIIAYARPFSYNEKDKDSKAAAKINPPQMNPEEENLHNKLIDCRNKIIAHSEIKYNPTSTNMDTGIIFRKRACIWSTLQRFDHFLHKNTIIALAKKMLGHCHHTSADLIHEIKAGKQPLN